MSFLSLSSGDLIADRRAEYAEALLPGDPVAASEIYLQALDLRPDWVAGWFRLGEIRMKADLPAAREAFETALRLDPEDRLGAALCLDLLRGRSLADSMPSAFVETLFDQYAAGFEESLVDRLDYRAPELLAQGLSGPLGRVLDLGCGTGLMGIHLRGCQWLEGWDISAEMLREAAAKDIYDDLRKADLSALDPQCDAWDLITAADVFAYLGALEQIVGWVASALRPGGRFAFTVEAHDGPEAYVLRPSRRFAHAAPHLADLLDRAGFEARLTPAILRQDRGRPIHGLVVHATRRVPDRQGDLRRDARQLGPVV
ncbi:methyltransferase [Paracoccus sp. 1_MG-2023]|uniref:class I SAM-dependent DNA methyltransferase n=1 Tax=unclassified Paracoccus (in: a-proteobacteria) TaxID=2688777 RepID=UPI001C07F580|nr:MULTISPECIES: methyltransferase domain-containing protein [unclassified Paracoccus (in: a-proteobacteria)]MBU2957838.1 methyltransferase domain-containing protein [Paracoccus sp. C2R09]MDO6667314.1 methyltransferase [Paracoccus sp. 1_MG-2023]